MRFKSLNKPAFSRGPLVCAAGFFRHGLFALCFMALFLIVACAPTANHQKHKRTQLVAARVSPDGPEVITTRSERSRLREFFSPANQRETTFSNNTTPRLAGGGKPNTGFVNTRRLNGPNTRGRGANAEYQAEFESPDLTIETIPHHPVLGSQWQAQLGNGPRVSLNFENEPIKKVVEKVLGGILGVNFLTSDTLEGTVTFRSEQSFTKPELIQILADILARQGYLMQYFNNIYHIAPPDELEQLTGLRARNGLGGSETRVVKVGPNAPENLVEVVVALAPPGTGVASLDGSNDLLLRGDASQFQSIEELIKNLVGGANTRQILTIVPMRNASPSEVVQQASEIYEARGLGRVSFVPVEQREGVLLVGASQREVNAARELLRNLDVDTRDKPTLRALQLEHMDASIAATQLNQIFGGGTVAPNSGNQQDGGSQSAIVAAGQSLASAGDAPRGVTSNGVQAPRFITGRGDQETTSAQATPASIPPGSAVQITADPRTNSLLIVSTYEMYRRISDVARTLDIPTAQVVIEGTIIEVAINDELEYGVQTYLEKGLNFARSSGGGRPGDPGGSGGVASLHFKVGDYSAQTVISALQAVTNVKVISSPYLTVSNGTAAELTVGDEIPFVVASQTSNSDGNVVVTNEVSTKSVGVRLQVTPYISPSNIVRMDIDQTISSSRAEQTTAGTNPVISQRRVSSQISVASGQTVLLGGLIQERTDTREGGVPVLRKVPVVGNLFNTKSNRQGRTELLVLMTPRVVRNGNQLTQITRQLKMSAASRR